MTARVRGVDLVWVDRVAAVLLTVGAIADASSEPHRQLGLLAIVPLVALTGSVAFRRADPVIASLVAISGFILFEVASHYNGDGSFEVAALALNFYTLGRRVEDRRLVVAVGVYWLGGTAVATFVPMTGTVGAWLVSWALAGVLPFAVGRALARRSALASELAAGAARLREEQELRVRVAAAEERNRMARELHDVIAHCMSVMVVQTGAARRVADSDTEAAREALGVVEGSGREALVELRRVVGVLRRGSGETEDHATPGLAGLGALVERCRAAGLPVELHASGQTTSLPADLDLIAYRVVQEALTNAIKHAGPASAQVRVEVGGRELELRVSDTGRGPAVTRADRNGAGHGLVGMAERVRAYGGDVHTGPRSGGGFEVVARIPLDQSMPAPSSASVRPRETITEAGVPCPWLDPVLAGVVLVVLEAAVLEAHHHRGPLALNMLAVAAIALAGVWRRRFPFAFLIVVGLLGSVMNTYLIELRDSPLIGGYFVLVPAYTVAAWAQDSEAFAGLALFIAGAAASELITQRGHAGDFAGAAFTVCAAWAAGRAIRSYRRLTSELERTNARLALEREDRARLAVAGERSRIARELHAAVAQSVAAMVVQAEAALTLLGHDPERAVTAMGTIEAAGRLALSEMRRILGVLRHGEGSGERGPQPGVDQIYALIQQARDRGQQIELSVDGELGTLAIGVELGLYRILETALQTTHPDADDPIGVSLHLDDEQLELKLTAPGKGPSGWPTDAMRARVALCGGHVDPVNEDNGWRFSARLPRDPHGALT